tara:strand:- start:891 stop:1223 length:333 start_codon:yes stop_codon:yes gene_type:complete
MIQAKLIGLLLKQVLKHPAIKDLFKYKDEPNDCDRRVDDLEQKLTDVGFKLTATLDMFKKYSESLDMVETKIKSFEKLAHPPAIDLKEFKEIKDAFKKMKKVTLLKSVFK